MKARRCLGCGHVDGELNEREVRVISLLTERGVLGTSTLTSHLTDITQGGRTLFLKSMENRHLIHWAGQDGSPGGGWELLWKIPTIAGPREPDDQIAASLPLLTGADEQAVWLDEESRVALRRVLAAARVRLAQLRIEGFSKTANSLEEAISSLSLLV